MTMAVDVPANAFESLSSVSSLPEMLSVFCDTFAATRFLAGVTSPLLVDVAPASAAAATTAFRTLCRATEPLCSSFLSMRAAIAEPTPSSLRSIFAETTAPTPSLASSTCTTRTCSLRNATSPFSADSPLPGGNLREPASALSRASAVVITHCEQAQQDVKKLEHDLQAAYEERAVELAISLLRLTFSEKGRVTLQHQLLLELLDEIAGLPPERFTVKTKSAQIRSAVALLDEERKRVSKILGEKLGVPVALEEAVEPSLIAGLTIQLGALKLDASLEHKLRQGVAYLKSWK